MTKEELLAAVDFETTYSNNKCSITTLGWDAYFRDPIFEAYLVAIKTNDGFEWVGHPSEAPWDKIKDHTWLSHNAAFDENLYLVAQELGWWGDVPTPKNWHCTSDMVSFLGIPRSLKNSVKEVFDVELSKEVRTSMDGLRPPDSFPCVNKNSLREWSPMTDEFWEAVLKYAIDDSVWCLKLWEEKGHLWPEKERWLSAHTRKIARRGIPVDIDYLNESISKVSETLFEFESAIPWRDTDELLSRQAFDLQCLAKKLTPPKSLNQNNAEAALWYEAHEKEHTWIYAYRNWRSANALLLRLKAIKRATRKVGGHYRFFGGLMYCGAHTKRWSGAGGNTSLHNMAASEMYGVSLRKIFRAPKGKKLVAIDLSQIEVRTLAWLAGDSDLLRRIAESDDMYQVYAEMFGLWDPSMGSMKKLGPQIRKHTKPIVLGSGFGASAFAFANKEYSAMLESVMSQFKSPKKIEAEARKFLEQKKKDRVGAWWWRKMGQYLNKSATVGITKTSPAGKEYATRVPAWKSWAARFIELEKTLKRGAPIPIDIMEWDWNWVDVMVYRESEKCIDLYRNGLPKTISFWNFLKDQTQKSLRSGSMEFEFPSGNSMHYPRLRRLKTKDKETGKESYQIYCRQPGNGGWRQQKVWHGLVTENLAQSLAREVFGHHLQRLEEDAKFPILFHVHDEVIGEVDESVAEDMLEKGVKIMKTAPDWIPDIPLDAEGIIGETFADCK